METTHAHNDQPGHVIERVDEGQPVYFSEKIGRDYAQPNGGWTTDKSVATVMTEAEANDRLEKGLAPRAPFCKVVAK